MSVPPAGPSARLDVPASSEPAGQPAGSASAARRYVVLGLGNVIQGDEALGGHVVDLLRRDPSPIASLADPGTVELIDGGTVGLGLIPYLAGLDGLAVVDVIDASATPGTLLDLDGADVLAHQPVMGVHDLGAEELLGALLFMDALPRRVRVLGMQPGTISLGTELSPPVATGVPELVAAVVRHLAAWQREDGVRPPG